jgi:hypothetical protein
MQTSESVTDSLVSDATDSAGTAGACLNCESRLEAQQRFCGHCGQKAGRERLTMRDIAHDFVHLLTHADHSIFSLVKDLAYRPGHVARDYIEGKRKKYFGPLAFLFITVGLASFMVLMAGAQFFTPVPDNVIANFLQQHINLVIFLQVPLLAAVCALLFRGSRLNYAEHLILAAYTSGFRLLFLALIGVPIFYLADLAPVSRTTAPVYLGLWLAYFSYAAVQFYRGRVAWTVVRAVICCVLAQVIAMTVIVFCIWVYTQFAYS